MYADADSRQQLLRRNMVQLASTITFIGHLTLLFVAQKRNFDQTTSKSFIEPSIDDKNAEIQYLAGRGQCKKAEINIRELQRTYEAGTETYVMYPPSRASFFSVLKAFASRSNKKNNVADNPAAACEAFFLWMLDLHFTMANDQMEINHELFSVVIESWARSHVKEAATRAERMLLRSLEFASQSKRQQSEKLDQSSYANSFNLVINAYAKGRDANVLEKAEVLMDMMQEHDIRPNAMTFTSLADCYAGRSGKDKRAAHKAEQILVRMVAFDIPPDVCVYNTIILAWARSKLPYSGQKADDMLREMERSDAVEIKPNVKTYTTVISAWAKKKSVNKAEATFKRMVDRYEHGDGSCKPDTFAYNGLINAYERSSQTISTERAVELLDTLEKSYVINGDEDLKPSDRTYAMVVGLLCRQKDYSATQKAEEILLHIQLLHESGFEEISPSVHILNTVLQSWSDLVDCGKHDAAEKSESLLFRAEKSVIDGEAEVSYRPNSKSFQITFDAWIKCGNDTMLGANALDRARRFLDWMENLFEIGNAAAKPSVLNHYVPLLNAWSRDACSYAAKNAEDTLDRIICKHKEGMSDTRLKASYFSAVISRWAKIKDSGTKCEMLLKRLQQHYVVPDIFVLNGVLNAYANCNSKAAATKAELLLNFMQLEYGVKPDKISYCIVIKVYSKSRHLWHRAAKAETLLSHMKQRYLNGDKDMKPTIVVYNSILNACAMSYNGRSEAVEIAKRIYTEACETDPNSVTFGTMLRVFENLLVGDEHRSKAALMVFRQCREAGQIDGFILKKIQQLAPSASESYFRKENLDPDKMANQIF